MFGLRSARPFLLSALQQGYVQSVHPYRTLLPTCVCPVPFARAPAGEPAQALGDGVTDVTLPCCMCVGVWLCAEPRLSLPAKEKPPAAACPPLRVSNPRSMAWKSSAFPVYYYPMWLETCFITTRLIFSGLCLCSIIFRYIAMADPQGLHTVCECVGP